MLVVPTWCRATSPPKVPKPTSEAMASPLLSLLARAIARALGIFSGALGFWPVGRCVCARCCGSANCDLPSCDVTNLVYGWFCGGIHEARVYLFPFSSPIPHGGNYHKERSALVEYGRKPLIQPGFFLSCVKHIASLLAFYWKHMRNFSFQGSDPVDRAKAGAAALLRMLG